MGLTEEVFGHVLEQVSGGQVIEYQGKSIDFTPPWKRISLYDALRETGDVEENVFDDREPAATLARGLGIAVQERDGHGQILTKLFDHLVEPQLLHPTFVTGYPTEVSPLSRRNDQDPSLTDRFELFIGGREIANAFTELNDPVDQKGRFESQVGALGMPEIKRHCSWMRTMSPPLNTACPRQRGKASVSIGW